MAAGQTVTAKANGLILTPNDVGEAPEGALAKADNAVISRESIIESRRGSYLFASITNGLRVKKLVPYKQRLLAWYEPSGGGAHKLALSNAAFDTYTDFGGSYDQPSGGTPMRAAEVNGNLYLTGAAGISRLDSEAGTPKAAGAPIGLDVEAGLQSATPGTGLQGDARFAYRVLWGMRDANNNLILGAPGTRFVLTSPAVTVGGGSLERTAGVVTATVTAHGFLVGDKVDLYPGETNFPAGTKTITAATSTTFSYTEAGTVTASTRSHRFQLVTVDAVVKVTIPPDATADHFLQVYRSPGSENAEIEPTDNMGLVYEASIPPTLAITTRTRTVGSVEVTTASNHGLASGSMVDIQPAVADFPAGVKTISVTAPNKFTYLEAGANASNILAQTSRPVTIVFVDSLPDSLLGAALYTNPQQEGILQANVQPPAARDVCEFKGCLVMANVDLPPRVLVTLLACGAPSGLQLGDAIQLGGMTFTADSAEDPNTRTFRLYTTGTPSQNVQDTANSLARVVNRDPANTTHIAYSLSGVEDEPGRIIFQRRTYGTTVDFNPGARITAWNPPRTTSGSGERQKNALYWSKKLRPDAVPFLNFTRLGSADKEILRIIPTRDSVYILKEDGVWRLSGDGPSTFRVDELDLTLRCIAPESAVALDGTCFAFTEQGVVRITETGIMVVSRGIEPVLQPLMAQALRATVKDISFGVAYESYRKYMLWVPTAAGQTSCPEAYVYDLFTDCWTKRTDQFRCAIVNPAIDILFLGEGSGVNKERKTFVGSNDYADRTLSVTINSKTSTTLTLADASTVTVGDGIGQGVDPQAPTTYAIVTAKNGNVLTVDRDTAGFGNGAALCFVGIAINVQWSPKFAQNPAALNHFREVMLLYRSTYFAASEIWYSTNVSAVEEKVSCAGSSYFAEGVDMAQFVLRTLVPLEKRRASQLNVRYYHRQARTNPVLQGVSILFNAGTTRAGM